MRRLRSLLRDARGQATLEFAFVSLFMFGTIMVALDFGIYAQQKLRLGSAVEQGALIAFKSGGTTGVATYIQNAAQTKVTPTVTITCNGTSTCGDGKCSCISGSTFTIVATCNATCAGSKAISGNYMKIAASLTYQSIVVPNKYLSGGTLSQTAVVRLPS